MNKFYFEHVKHMAFKVWVLRDTVSLLDIERQELSFLKTSFQNNVGVSLSIALKKK